MSEVNLSADVETLGRALLAGLQAALADKLVALYVYGAVVFPEAAATGDIDFHVILRAALTGPEKEALHGLHAALARDHPPMGAELDGYYILLEDARAAAPPPHQLLPGVADDSWALHREHLRAGRCLVLYGPQPADICPPASWSELDGALQGELQYVQDRLTEYPAYCVLNLCRLMLSYQTRNVVLSKAGAAAWAWDAFPQWRQHIDLARKAYARQVTPGEEESLRSSVGDLYRWACHRIEADRARWASTDRLDWPDIAQEPKQGA